MMMIREKLDEYLDGALDAAGRRDVEAALARDPEAAALADRMKRERALRAAVYDSYAPSSFEAGELAAQVLAACEDAANEPVGHIGHHGHFYWTRRLAGVAAAIVIAAGAFAAGRVTAPQMATVASRGNGGGSTPNVVYRDHYNTVTVDPYGHMTEAVYDNAEQWDRAKQNWARQNGVHWGPYSSRIERASGEF